ncbi:hypothetical protein HWV23_04105 [Natronomonas halophila]|uniref:hypothetical protein n=1 Tax=Natronomonas halophila TaxID=2747817 RepID=UPI0015B70716|nr:hypothetical protein [Natronomonas halophila]QLD84935.1 hypothetical protein HWV23_04105 [Natronomonas halophila]
MHKPRGEPGSEIEYYAGSDVTAGALTLLNHPVVHSTRVLNHRRAEGIDVDGLDVEFESASDSD